MPTLLLSRATKLTPVEIARLPRGARATDGADGVVACADLDLPLAGLLGFAVSMGRAIPDAVFSVLEAGAALPAVAPAAPEPGDAPANITEHDPWKLVAAGDYANAEKVLAGVGLDATGRERVRALWRGPDPGQAAFGCRAARAAGWKAAVTDLRRLLTHGHPDVRRDAALALGDLAGPSLAMALRPLEKDPDADVRAAAKEALGKLGG